MTSDSECTTRGVGAGGQAVPNGGSPGRQPFSLRGQNARPLGSLPPCDGAEVSALGGVQTPRNLGAAGRKLWDAGVAEFEWAQHELAVLEEACRTRDRIVQLDKAVEEEGLMLASSQGMRVHPAVAEARQQRLVMARLLATLGIPPMDEDALPAARGVRGIYRGGR